MRVGNRGTAAVTEICEWLTNMYVCMYVCMYVYVSRFGDWGTAAAAEICELLTNMYLCMYIHTYVCMYVLHAKDSVLSCIQALKVRVIRTHIHIFAYTRACISHVTLSRMRRKRNGITRTHALFE
jgi:hypothetical protein